MSSISFGMTAKPPALPRRDDVLVDKCTNVTKPCLSPVEMCTPTAAGGLLPAGTSSTVMRTIFPRPLFLTASERPRKKAAAKQTVSLHPPCWRRVIQTKSRQTLGFDSGGCTGRLRACPFLGMWRALLCGEVIVWTFR